MSASSMAIYTYEAADKRGAIHSDRIDASSKDEVLIFLGRKDLIPILVEEEGKRAGLSLSTSFFERITALDRITLVRNLAVTLKAGLSIIEAIDILIMDTSKNVLRNILQNAKASLQKGQPLSAIFSRYRKYFSPVFTGLLQAGEASGHMDKALEQLAEQMDKEYKLGKKVKSALAYPVLLLITSVLVIIMLLIFVMPRLARSFRMSGAELPTITKVLITISNAVASNILLDVLVVAFLIFGFKFFKRTAFGSKVLVHLVLRIPIAKELVKKVALVRFSRNLGSLIGSGINIVDGLQISAQTVGNEVYKNKILSAVPQIKNGVALSDILKGETKYFPHLLVNMISVGERTGTLEYVLKTFSDFYEEEVDNTLKDLTTFLEPLMLLFMGVIIGTIALSILLPIYQLISKFA